MQPLGLNQLREMFLAFFESKGHLRLPSFSLVPRNDKSLLLINSGMAPLKPYFTGAATPPRKRVATCQKCVRTLDIANVGKTSRHGTFFEMLGNFSFGDYFKREAITWAWEFFTCALDIPERLLYPSVYEEDDEAHAIWRSDAGVPAERITRLGKADNFWEHGLGPCGPCSEIYFDRGPSSGCGKPGCAPGCDCDRYVEVWNLVFTQFEKQPDGAYTPLPNPNIDTGMGLERLACVMQGVDNIFEVDTIRRLVDETCAMAGVKYGQGAQSDVSARVVADHIRSASMLAADGVSPSNEGRGYVMRRLLRSAARHGRSLGIEPGFLEKLSGVVAELSGDAYPELNERREPVARTIAAEESRFAQTLDLGLSLVKERVAHANATGSGTIDGDSAFRLHDTFGFPIDLTREIAAEAGLDVDEDGFAARMAEQRGLARNALKDRGAAAWGRASLSEAGAVKPTQFLGYDASEANTTIVAILSADGEPTGKACAGETVTLALEATPFYAESGGQLDDSGTMLAQDGEATVFGCKKSEDGVYLHTCEITSGEFAKGARVTARIDAARRRATAMNHTATHLLHKALRLELGEHVAQAGSMVGPDRLRFDFTHFEQVSREALARVEQAVNDRIAEAQPVETQEMPIEDAKGSGAAALFDEKYGDIVRVVSIGDYSRELCGGTHASGTAQIGLFVVSSESGVAAGVRRIEAMTGAGAYRWLKERDELIREAAGLLKTTPEDLPRRVEAAIRDGKAKDREIAALAGQMATGMADEAIAQAVPMGGIKLAVLRMDKLDADGLRILADSIRDKDPACVAALATGRDGKAAFVVSCGRDAVAAGAHAGNIVRGVAKAAGGGGGGRPDMAQAGGKDASLIDAALAEAPSLLSGMIKRP